MTLRYSLSGIFSPLTKTSPAVVPRLFFLARISRKVDLPAPEAPMIAMICPGWATPDTSTRICLPFRPYEMFSNCRAAGLWLDMSLELSSSESSLRRIAPYLLFVALLDKYQTSRMTATMNKAHPAITLAMRGVLISLTGLAYPGTSVLYRHSPARQSSVMLSSPKIDLM